MERNNTTLNLVILQKRDLSRRLLFAVLQMDNFHFVLLPTVARVLTKVLNKRTGKIPVNKNRQKEQQEGQHHLPLRFITWHVKIKK
jgi:hypothetical protein